jgi:hypothetical protein
MTRKYRITIVKDEEFFRLALHPFRYRKTPFTGKIDFVSERLFDSETAAVHQARSTFGNEFVFKRNQAGELHASFILRAAELPH